MAFLPLVSRTPSSLGLYVLQLRSLSQSLFLVLLFQKTFELPRHSSPQEPQQKLGHINLCRRKNPQPSPFLEHSAQGFLERQPRGRHRGIGAGIVQNNGFLLVLLLLSSLLLLLLLLCLKPKHSRRGQHQHRGSSLYQPARGFFMQRSISAGVCTWPGYSVGGVVS